MIIVIVFILLLMSLSSMYISISMFSFIRRMTSCNFLIVLSLFEIVVFENFHHEDITYDIIFFKFLIFIFDIFS